MISALILSAMVGISPIETSIATMDVERPAREARTMAVMGELGWNGLSGLGVNYTWNAHRHFSLDVGAGVGASGARGGVRGRYNMLSSSVTPFVGAGLGFVTGLGNTVVSHEGEGMSVSGRSVGVKYHAMPSAQLSTGLSWIAKSGFTMLGTLGYSVNLREHGYTVASGALTDKGRQVIDMIAGNGPIVSLAMGYAF